MERRTRLRRTKPLPPGLPLQRSPRPAGPTVPVQGSRRTTAPVQRRRTALKATPGTMSPEERAAKAIVAVRSGGVSEISGRPHVDASHRIGRGAGGLWAADNLCHLTRLEHGWLTQAKNRLHAEAGGWVLRSWQDPSAEPIYLPMLGGWVYLLSDGTVTEGPVRPRPARGPWEVWS